MIYNVLSDNAVQDIHNMLGPIISQPIRGGARQAGVYISARDSVLLSEIYPIRIFSIFNHENEGFSLITKENQEL